MYIKMEHFGLFWHLQESFKIQQTVEHVLKVNQERRVRAIVKQRQLKRVISSSSSLISPQQSGEKQKKPLYLRKNQYFSFAFHSFFEWTAKSTHKRHSFKSKMKKLFVFSLFCFVFVWSFHFNMLSSHLQFQIIFKLFMQ